MISIFFSGLVIGLAGAGHCLGMCGGLASMLSMGGNSKPSWLIFYNIGRGFSYITFTVIISSALYFGLTEYYTEAMEPLRTIAGIILILMGLYICGASKLILKIEKSGRFIWQWVQPLAKSFLPIQSSKQAFVAGMLWGWLPCGLVYSTVLWSVSLGSVTLSMAAILGFVIGTMPSMFLAGMFSQQIKNAWNRYHLKWIFGLSIILYGAYSIPIVKNLLSSIG
ncbi:sulfite exporter TauE/SafE family protein [Marinomonas ostreistagni]|uniref:Sulfite exporter TauE/SafE family protein n=1 Tax=Marinomonas ostreistagni TaxID=359209 RepID=A0ABS0Z7D9_9GAMM|nr:sulfite exporter TauE/SafE family protein [Marinomonas ostreistagni]MBJ7549504.1 sulfite exporter TauE/SafE family protein [Marinomonas ostreistagni]